MNRPPFARRAPARALLFTVLIVLAATVVLIISTETDTSPADETAYADVVEQVDASVVTVYTYTEGGSFSPGATGREPSGAGSGWIYSDDGLVVTNAHVVLEAERVSVVTQDGTVIPTSVVGTDWYQDVAVLQLEPDDGQELPQAASVGNSDTLRAGDPVIAIGTPHGQFANTVSVGTVGAVGRTLNTGVGYSLLNLIQHDASLSPGNSGGPLFSVDGEVVGTNVASGNSRSPGQPSTDDVSFAIDGNTVVDVAEEIVANGSPAYPYLGITSEPADGGQRVVAVEADSPARETGLRPKDLITALNGEAVTEATPFIDLLYRHEPDDVVTLRVVRGGHQVELKATLAPRPAGS